MSYSSDIKDEICKNTNYNYCCMVTELAAVVRLLGHKECDGNSFCIKIHTENENFAYRFKEILNIVYGISADIFLKYNVAQTKGFYIITIKSCDLSSDVMEDFNNIIPIYGKFGNRKDSKCCIKAFIRGAFLASGTISDPNKSYHVEIICHDDETAAIVCTFMNDFNLSARIVLRKSVYVVYIKDAENISDFLNIIGAYKSLIDFQNIRILKEVRGNINRAVNCETANIQKSLDASFKQLEDIKLIQKTIGLEALPDNLRAVAEIRLNNAELSLVEIGFKLNPPIGKSGVNHRLKKINEIANDLRK